jgi:hypothetical protein
MLSRNDLRQLRAIYDDVEAADVDLDNYGGKWPFATTAQWIAFVCTEHRRDPFAAGLSEADLGQAMYELMGISREAATADAELLEKIGFHELSAGIRIAARRAKSARPTARNV